MKPPGYWATYSREYRKRHPERTRAAVRKWHAKNREHRLEYLSDWNKAHPGYSKECLRLWRARNPAAARALTLAWREQNPDYGRLWRLQNRDKAAAYLHKRRAAEGFFTEDDVQVLLKAQRNRCAAPHCRRNIRHDYSIDHIHPLCLGGSNWPSNIQLLCLPCNLSKGRATMNAWLARVASL